MLVSTLCLLMVAKVRCLPATTASKRSVVAASPASATATTAAPTSVATPASTSAVVASHLCETWVDLLVCLLQNLDKFTGLLGICDELLASSTRLAV